MTTEASETTACQHWLEVESGARVLCSRLTPHVDGWHEHYFDHVLALVGGEAIPDVEYAVDVDGLDAYRAKRATATWVLRWAPKADDG